MNLVFLIFLSKYKFVINYLRGPMASVCLVFSFHSNESNFHTSQWYLTSESAGCFSKWFFHLVGSDGLRSESQLTCTNLATHVHEPAPASHLSAFRFLAKRLGFVVLFFILSPAKIYSLLESLWDWRLVSIPLKFIFTLYLEAKPCYPMESREFSPQTRSECRLL